MHEPRPAMTIQPTLPSYAELQCVSNFSFLRGASHADELTARAAELGYTALAITDECSLAGVARAHTEAKKQNLHLLIGSQFQLTSEDGSPAVSLILLAQNREGYGNLSELITLARTQAGVAKGSYHLMPSDLSSPTANHAHLRGMPDCLAILTPAYGVCAQHLAPQAAWLKQTFPNRAWIALTLIEELAYEPYFLTVFDIVRFARRQNILCQGRGSAATSAVCYCLGITEVDPARGNLLFERFISKERNEPPDKSLLRHAAIQEDAIVLAAPSEAENIIGDYRALPTCSNLRVDVGRVQPARYLRRPHRAGCTSAAPPALRGKTGENAL